jgi:hypothetical protein
VKVLGPEGATRVSLVIRTGGHKIIAMAWLFCIRIFSGHIL